VIGVSWAEWHVQIGKPNTFRFNIWTALCLSFSLSVSLSVFLSVSVFWCCVCFPSPAATENPRVSEASSRAHSRQMSLNGMQPHRHLGRGGEGRVCRGILEQLIKDRWRIPRGARGIPGVALACPLAILRESWFIAIGSLVLVARRCEIIWRTPQKHPDTIPIYCCWFVHCSIWKESLERIRQLVLGNVL